eukprot:scaffold25032_cov49-Prasinocladus_malaysianus.AAC.2
MSTSAGVVLSRRRPPRVLLTSVWAVLLRPCACPVVDDIEVGSQQVLLPMRVFQSLCTACRLVKVDVNRLLRP